MIFKNRPQSLAEIFIAETAKEASSKNQSLACMPTDNLFDIPLEDRTLGWLAEGIKRCPGYRIDEEVVVAAQKFFGRMVLDEERRKKYIQTLEDHPKLYAVPFPVMWVEWKAKNPNGVFVRNGLLLENLTNPIGVRSTLVAQRESLSYCFPNTSTPILMHSGSPKKSGSERIYSGKNRIMMQDFFEGNPDQLQDMRQLSEQSFSTGLAIMMILKSRTKILQMVPPPASHQPSSGSGNIKPATSQHKHLGKVTFDLTRTLAKGRAVNEEQAKKLLAEQIVMGHFKLREVRNRDADGNKLPGFEQLLIWWDPFLRNGTPEERAARLGKKPIKPRKAEAIIRDNRKPLQMPGIDFTS